MIKLEFIEKEDLVKFLEWNIDKDSDYLLQWAGPTYEYPLTMEQLEEGFLEKGVNTRVYKIINIDSNEIIGSVEIREVDGESKVGRICRFIIGDGSNRGKGVGQAALKEVLKVGFEEVKFETITLGVFDFNTSAINCYEKVGFRKKKLIEKARNSLSGYWNLYEMEITREELNGRIS